MQDFKERFAKYNPTTGHYVFSNVRNGLIVGLVCAHITSISPMPLRLTLD